MASASASASPTVLPFLTVGSGSSTPVRAEPSSHKPAPHVSLLPLAAWRIHHSSLSPTLAGNSGFRFLAIRPTETKRVLGIVAMATGESADPSKTVSDALKSLQDAWDKTHDKLAVGGLGFAALIVLWASTGLISAIDKLPLIPTFFELIGILFSGWFIYRYLLFKPDREELVKIIEDTTSKITGAES